MKIQFLLLGDGASHKFLGITPVKGLQELGIDVEYYFRSRNSGKILNDPDYVFVLKPNPNDIKQPGIAFGKHIALIISDQRQPIEFERTFDFFVTCSQSWQKEYQLRHPDKPCYLIKEEYDYYTTKIHKPQDKLKVVTMGYSINLLAHFIPAIEQIKKVTDDITIVASTNEPEFEKHGCKFVQFQPHSSRFMEDCWDKIAVKQFNQYDVGIITAYKTCGRPSTRGKAFMYAGLPIIAPNVIEYQDIWFNDRNTNGLLLYNNLTGIAANLRKLQKSSIRQDISNYNTYRIESQFGAKKAGESFLGAIKKYEAR